MLCLTIYKTAPIVVRGNFLLELEEIDKESQSCTIKYQGRKYELGEKSNISIEDNISIQFNGFYKHGVKLGFSAPRGISIDRLRVHQAKGGSVERP